MSFRQDFVAMLSATTGTGPLTCTTAAATYNFATKFETALAAAWGAGTFEGEYVIEEASTGKWEVGIGSYVTSTGVLTRTLPSASFDGTTLTYAAAPKVNFASAALVVYISDSQSTQTLVFPGTANISSAIGASTLGIFPLNHQKGAAGSAATVDREYYVPIFWPGNHQIDQINQRCTGAATTGNCKAAWYEIKQNGLPGAKLFDFGAFATGGNGVNNVKAVTGFCPPPGWYVYGCVHDAAVSFLQVLPAWGQTPLGTDATVTLIQGYFRTGSYAAGMPDPASTVSPTAVTGNTGTGVALPALTFRMAA